MSRFHFIELERMRRDFRRRSEIGSQMAGWRGERRGGWIICVRGRADRKADVRSAQLTETSIQTWALEEARRRLEAEGILAEPVTKA